MIAWCRRNSTLMGALAVSCLIVTVLSLFWALVSIRSLRTILDKVESRTVTVQGERDLALSALYQLVAELQRQLDKPAIASDNQRKLLLNVVLDGLRKVTSAADVAGATDINTAIARQQLGEVFLRLEKFDAAQEQLRQATDLLARLQTEQPKDETIRQHNAESEGDLAEVQVALDRSAEARTHFKAAIRHWQSLTSATPENSAFQFQLARTWQRLGQLEGADGTAKAMRVAYENALQIFAELAQQKPLDPEANENLATTHLEIGSLDHAEGKLDLAHEHYNTAIELVTKLLEQQPDDNLRALLLPYLVTRGELELERDQVAAAETDFRRALELGQAIAEPNQIPDDWLLMAVAHRRLVTPLIETDPIVALEELRISKALLERARSELESQAERQHHAKKEEADSARGLEEIYADDVLAELAITSAKLAMCLFKQGNTEEGQKLLDEATVLASEFPSVDSGGDEPWRETATMLIDLGESESLAGHSETARELLTDAASVVEAVSLDEHATFADQQLVCRLYRAIIPLDEAAGMHKSAAKWLAKLVGVLDELQQSKLLTDKPERAQWLENQRQSLPKIEPPPDKAT